MSTRTKKELDEIRGHLLAVRDRIDDTLDHWPPEIEPAAFLRHDLGYALHLADALEVHAQAVVERRCSAN